MNLPQNAILIAEFLRHPADEERGGLHVYALVRFAEPDSYAMIGIDASVRTVDRRWASGVELRTIRKRLGLTQARLAALLHTTGNNIARYERGERPIPWASMQVARSLVPTNKQGV